MKFNPDEILRIENRASINRLMGEIKNHDTVKARIVKRYSPREAIIEIKGRRIKTEFTSAIPEKSEVTLKLINSDSGSYLFKIVDQGVKSEIISILNDVSLLDGDELDSLNLSLLKEFINRNRRDLYSLNLLLMQRGNLNRVSRDIPSLLRDLKTAGFKTGILNILSLLSVKSCQGIDILILLLSTLGFLKDFGQKYFKKEGIETGKLISDIIEMIDNSYDEKEKDTIIRKLIDLLGVKSGNPEEFTAGEQLFFHEEGEKKIIYLKNKKSWLFSLSLSKIGIIDIIARQISHRIEISLFAENNSILEILKSSQSILERRLKAEGITAFIEYRNRGSMIDRIYHIAAKGFPDNSIDVKV